MLHQSAASVPPGPHMNKETISQAGLDAHYRTFFETQERDFRAAAVARLIYPRLNPKEPVLDVGCGSCTVTSFLLQKKLSVTAIDNSEEMVRMAKGYLRTKGLPTDGLDRMDLAECLERFPHSFTQIICLDVIEHIQDDDAALANLYHLLSPGGKLILSVPAHPRLFGPKDERVGHYRRYARSPLCEQVRAAGFQIEEVRWWNLLGFIAVWCSLKIFNRSIDEKFRTSKRSNMQMLLNTFLKNWCIQVENRVSFPTGLTLLVVARKPNE